MATTTFSPSFVRAGRRALAESPELARRLEHAAELLEHGRLKPSLSSDSLRPAFKAQLALLARRK